MLNATIYMLQSLEIGIRAKVRLAHIVSSSGLPPRHRLPEPHYLGYQHALSFWNKTGWAGGMKALGKDGAADVANGSTHRRSLPGEPRSG